MRAVIQRVKQASVTVDGAVISQIQQGLFGITHGDTEADAEYIARKITTLRLWPDSEGKPWKLNVNDAGLEVLSVSQFTLFAITSKGAKPDFHLAMKGTDSLPFYQSFLGRLRTLMDNERVQDGQFGAMMDVGLINDGPVTLIVDSREK